MDGFITNVADASVIDVSEGPQVTGRKAEVIKAAHLGADATLRMVKPGNHAQATESRNEVAHSSNCTPVEGVLHTH